jgi:hypothetical protein
MLTSCRQAAGVAAAPLGYSWHDIAAEFVWAVTGAEPSATRISPRALV